ncbi:MAG TPA: hypothetical protein VLE44_00235 [Candidatus Saccharimonadales bacterium]|nr:hypothetical protein [Candidatus Saccharimonadales bacterium]
MVELDEIQKQVAENNVLRELGRLILIRKDYGEKKWAIAVGGVVASNLIVSKSKNAGYVADAVLENLKPILDEIKTSSFLSQMFVEGITTEMTERGYFSEQLNK